MSGWCSRTDCTASSPFLASATICKLGPHLGQARAHLFAHQALVVGEHGARYGVRHRFTRGDRSGSRHRSVQWRAGHQATPSSMLL